jgi:membrane protein
MSALLPAEVTTILDDQMRELSKSDDGLGIGLVIAIVAALWTASGGMHSLIDAINLAYDVKKPRGWLATRALALAATIGAIVLSVLGVALLGALPVLADRVGLGGATRTAIDVLRWPALAVLAQIALSALYRYAPAGTRPKRWRWVSWGSVLALVLWLASTAVFSFYAANFATYNETYGAIGGVIILLLWLYLTSLAILVGAELDAEIEHHEDRGRRRLRAVEHGSSAQAGDHHGELGGSLSGA